MMKAAFYYGERQIKVDTSTPIHPATGEVQIKVSHVGICGTDLHIYHGMMDKRVNLPQIMGHEMAGIVHAIGPGVDGYQPADRVTVMPLAPCGKCPACEAGHSHICHNLKFLGIDTPGALQSLWTVPAYTLHRLPDSLLLMYGALIEPLAVACHDVRLAEVQQDDYIVVLGGGPIGMLIALVARHAGAKVLLSEINPFRIDLARSFGFEVINPQEADLLAHVTEETNGAGADIVFEVTGSVSAARMMTQLVRTRGMIVVVAIFGKPPEVDLFRVFWRELNLRGVRVYESQDFEQAIDLAASGILPLDRLVSEVLPLENLKSGFEEMESGGSVMKILVEI